MQFIRLPKLIDIAERELPELVADWMNMKSVQNINISFVLKLRVNMLISWDIEWSKCWTPHRGTFRNFTHRAWVIWDLSNHELFWIIPDPGCQKRITLSLEFICTIPFQAGTSDVKIPEWGQHCSNCGMPCLVRIFGTFRGTWNQRNDNLCEHVRCPPDIFANITNCEIQWAGMLIRLIIGSVNLVGCTNDWYNCHSCRKLIWCIPPPVASCYGLEV